MLPRRMRHFNFHAINTAQPLRQALGEVDGSMLAASTSKCDLKMVAPITFVFFDRLANKSLGSIKKDIHLLRELGEEIGDRLVASGVTAQGFVPERIGHCPAVEHKAPAVANRIVRQPSLERE